MCHSKILFSLVTAGLFICSNSINASVHDFGNLRPSLPDLNEQPVTYSIRFDLTAEHVNGISNDFAFNSITHGGTSSAYSHNGHDIVREDGVDLIESGYGQRGQDKQFYNTPHVSPITAVAVTHDTPSNTTTPSNTPITSPVPEPETYAMIIAGLLLIGYTTRRRNRID